MSYRMPFLTPCRRLAGSLKMVAFYLKLERMAHSLNNGVGKFVILGRVKEACQMTMCKHFKIPIVLFLWIALYSFP
jgi:hypothetical protein